MLKHLSGRRLTFDIATFSHTWCCQRHILWQLCRAFQGSRYHHHSSPRMMWTCSPKDFKEGDSKFISAAHMFSKFWWSTRLFIVAVPPHPRCIFFTHPIFCWQLSDQNSFKLSQACSEYAISEDTGQFCLKSRRLSSKSIFTLIYCSSASSNLAMQ